MSRLDVFKNTGNHGFRKVNEFTSFGEAEEFVHAALNVEKNRTSLYTIEWGMDVLTAYKLVDGQIICHDFNRVLRLAA